jgi:hypothetical protein
VRARGLAVYNAVFAGAMTLGSVIWGQMAGLVGIPIALMIAAGGALFGILLTRRFHLQTRVELDLAPSSHWPQPILTAKAEPDTGPVMNTVEYRIDPATMQSFLSAMGDLEKERRRDGAYAWGIFQDTAVPGRMLEYFIEDSWLEHLRHHERVTQADRDIEERVRAFHVGVASPRVTHYLAGDAGSLPVA